MAHGAVLSRKIGSRYVAHKILGRGASGTVWQGEGPDGPVAIKLLREDLASDQILVARFVQERTVLTSLEHVNIVGVHDLVVDGTDLALVMDLVLGSDLRQRLDRDRVLAPQLAVAVVADVAEGLAAAHAAGVIHRDVKPENILLDPGAGMLRARLTDFGIARLLDSPRRTRATRIVGTPDYLAPEVIEGCQPTAAVDVYALGTVLFELLTGWTPFGGAHPGAVLRRHVTEPVPPIPGLPQPLAQLVNSCLSKAPAARLTAGEVAERLRGLLPSVVGMPALDIPDPGEEEDEGYPGAAGAVPVVDDPEPDESTSDTHFSLRRPKAAALPVPEGPAARREPRTHRRGRTAALAGLVALVLVGGGILAYVVTRPSHGGAPAVAATTAAGGPGVGPSAGATAVVGTSGGAGLRLGGAMPAWKAAQTVTLPGDGIVGGVRAVAVGQQTSFVFARSGDGSLVYTAYDGSRFAAWQAVSGLRTLEDPAVVTLSTTQLDVFAVDSSTRHLKECLFSGGKCVGGWTTVDSAMQLAGGPAAVASDPAHVAVVAATADGTLVVAEKTDGVWQPFKAVSAPGQAAFHTSLDPALVTGPDGRPVVVAVSADGGAVMQIAETASGAWQAPAALGVTSSSRPEVVASGESQAVLVRAPDGSVSLFGAQGSAPQAVPGAVLGGAAPADTPAVDVTGNGRIDIYTLSGDGELYHAET